jgi:hypothetical protein
VNSQNKGAFELNNTNKSPTFIFFRKTPKQLLECPPLASSLQTFETVLLLLSLDKFPNALVSCVSACESTIKAKLNISPGESYNFFQLIDKIRKDSSAIDNWIISKGEKISVDKNKKKQTGSVWTLTEKRNLIVHYGYSPSDDEECASLLLDLGLPFLKLLYEELFDFYLDWKDLRPDCNDFMEITDQDSSKVGLLPEISEHLRFAFLTHTLASKDESNNLSYCFKGIAHLIRLGLKNAQITESEFLTNEKSISQNLKWEAEEQIKANLLKVFKSPTENFNCPVCSQSNSLIAELSPNSNNEEEIKVTRCACINCSFFIRQDELFLSNILLRTQIKKII